MPQLYTVRQEGLSLDLILWRVHGRRGQALVGEALELNVGLAALGTTVPVGHVLTLPDLPVQSATVAAQPVDFFA